MLIIACLLQMVAQENNFQNKFEKIFWHTFVTKQSSYASKKNSDFSLLASGVILSFKDRENKHTAHSPSLPIFRRFLSSLRLPHLRSCSSVVIYTTRQANIFCKRCICNSSFFFHIHCFYFFSLSYSLK